LQGTPGRTRLILLGDSYTAGDGVCNEARFSDLLEQRFPDLDVLNFGLPNTGTDQHLLILDQKTRMFAADAIVLCVSVENIFRLRQKWRPALEWATDTVYYRAKPYFEIERGQLVLRHVPVPAAIIREDELGDRLAEFRDWPSATEDPYDAYCSADTPEWQLMDALIRRIGELAAGKPLLVAVLPTIDFILKDRDPVYWERFRALADPVKRRWVVDVLPDFLGLPAASRRACLFPQDPHFSAEGHRVVAEALARALAVCCPELVNSSGPRTA
jgi:carbamoyltransferase